MNQKHSQNRTFTPALPPVLETERMILRGAKRSDFDAYAEFWASDRSSRFGFDGPCDRDTAWNKFMADAGQWSVLGFGFWFGEEKSTGGHVGSFGYYFPDEFDEPELGWTAAADYEGKSFAFEAVTAVRAYGSAHFGIEQPASFIAVDNERSIRLAERLGATREDTRANGHGAFHVYRHPMTEVKS